MDADSRTGCTDTLADLIVCRQNDRFLFIDLKTGKTVETFNESYLYNQPDWQIGEEFSGLNLPPLDLPHRDVLRPAGRLPFNLSAEPPVEVGGDKDEPAEDSGTTRGFFGRLFGRFTGSKSGQESPKEDFFRKAMQVRSNISLALKHRQGRAAAGVREYVDKALGRFPEFRQPENFGYFRHMAQQIRKWPSRCWNTTLLKNSTLRPL